MGDFEPTWTLTLLKNSMPKQIRFQKSCTNGIKRVARVYWSRGKDDATLWAENGHKPKDKNLSSVGLRENRDDDPSYSQFSHRRYIIEIWERKWKMGKKKYSKEEGGRGSLNWDAGCREGVLLCSIFFSWKVFHLFSLILYTVGGRECFPWREGEISLMAQVPYM